MQWMHIHTRLHCGFTTRLSFYFAPQFSPGCSGVTSQEKRGNHKLALACDNQKFDLPACQMTHLCAWGFSRNLQTQNLQTQNNWTQNSEPVNSNWVHMFWDSFCKANLNLSPTKTHTCTSTFHTTDGDDGQDSHPVHVKSGTNFCVGCFWLDPEIVGWLFSPPQFVDDQQNCFGSNSIGVGMKGERHPSSDALHLFLQLFLIVCCMLLFLLQPKVNNHLHNCGFKSRRTRSHTNSRSMKQQMPSVFLCTRLMEEMNIQQFSWKATMLLHTCSFVDHPVWHSHCFVKSHMLTWTMLKMHNAPVFRNDPTLEKVTNQI